MRRNWMPSCLPRLALLLAYPLFCAVGCGPSSTPAPNATATKSDHDHEHGHDHDHDHDHGTKEKAAGGGEGAAKPAAIKAENYADAIRQLTAMHGTMKTAFGKKDIDAAHGPLHDVGGLLELIPVLASKETKDEATLAAIRKSVDELFDYYGKVDEKLHGETGATYEEVSSKIDAAFEKLKAVTIASDASDAPASSTEPAPPAAP
ncbi:MAG: hypothetical protein RLY70_4695 [Planctomycetota bacterium]|jgi:hypothetical protein